MPYLARALTKTVWVRAGKTSFEKTSYLPWHVGGGSGGPYCRAQEIQREGTGRYVEVPGGSFISQQLLELRNFRYLK